MSTAVASPGRRPRPLLVAVAATSLLSYAGAAYALLGRRRP